MTQYSMQIVINDVITIPKWRTATILDFAKKQLNFAQDWGIWFKFCVKVQNITVNRITWPKFHLNKIQDGGGRHHRAISKPWTGGLSSNLVRWCSMTPCSRKHGQNHHFHKKKMAAAAILDFGKIAITLRRIEGFGWNVVRRFKITP